MCSVRRVKKRLTRVEQQLFAAQRQLRLVLLQTTPQNDCLGDDTQGPRGETIYTPPSNRSGGGGHQHSPDKSFSVQQQGDIGAFIPVTGRDTVHGHMSSEAFSGAASAENSGPFDDPDSYNPEDVRRIIRPTHFDPPHLRGTAPTPSQEPVTEKTQNERVSPSSDDDIWRLRRRRESEEHRASESPSWRYGEGGEERGSGRPRSEPTLKWPPKN